MTTLFKSIRWRLQAWYGLMLCLVLMAFGFTAFLLVRENRLRRIDQELEQRLSALMEVIRPGPVGREGSVRAGELRLGPRGGSRRLDEEPRARGIAGESPRELLLTTRQESLFAPREEGAFYYVMWAPQGEVIQQSATAPDDVPMPRRSRPGAGRMNRVRGDFREFMLVNRRGLRVVVGRSVARDLAEFRRLAWLLVLVGGGVLVLGMAGGWWVSTRAIRPIDEISQAAHRMTAGSLADRINVTDTDSELGQLANVLNSTFDRLQAAFARQTQFTADASHELRTPVAVLLSQTQTALARNRSSADYRETLDVCMRTAQRMRHLIESLLMLARLDAAEAVPRREACELDELTREVVELLRPLAKEHRVRLEAELESVKVQGDGGQLTQAITNLVNNAIAYNRPEGEVRVAVSTDKDKALLMVRDSGLGIAMEHLNRIFDRFYRVDPARGRSQGRTGLGLAITRSIVEAHGGDIAVTSKAGVGTTFTVRLPITTEAEPKSNNPQTMKS